MQFNISKQLWVAKSERKGDYKGTLLAYMSQVDFNKDGSLAASFKKKQQTGMGWAGKNAETCFVDNVPVSGHFIGDSVERWVTENKYFRVTDPRGFVLEVPTGNISTLLYNCTVIKGVIQEPCVWVRMGSQHVLLPEGSSIYKEAVSFVERKESAKTVKDMVAGDRCTLLSYGTENKTEAVYLGQVKLSWHLLAKKGRYSSRGWGAGRWGYHHLERELDRKEFTEKDSKWVSVFAKKLGNQWSIDFVLSPKATDIQSGSVPDELQNLDLVDGVRWKYDPLDDRPSSYYSVPERVVKCISVDDPLWDNLHHYAEVRWTREWTVVGAEWRK
ncbi:hypothetical protein [Pseudomonas phage vB_PaeM_C2-10_Ab08]|uniref:Uncharacterized protein n=2 Tax=Pakpunavirus TaxID=1921407 RepID=A0A172CF58_9CAUD|nr:hypothetical protein BIZ94_gp035 [Pseudomonas phage vB_PaeM_MAG1]ALA12015.1 hypothetical protein vB_PaeM_MAG1_035 [Pseudomonas phage vB_PaeM_MAG1]CEF89454.1 hypothetical protein [Pseudomonas phage vB_PaeM_C2-10_Ab08]